MNYTIRRAGPADLEKVISLATEMVIHSISPFRAISPQDVKEFRRKDLAALNDAIAQPHVGVFIAEEEGRGRFLGHVVVVCGYMESSTGESQGWVFDLSVIPECWNSGIGRRLMDEAESFCVNLGFRYLGLGVTSANARAVQFYEKLGFAEERKRMIKRLPLPAAAPPPAPSPSSTSAGPLDG